MLTTHTNHVYVIQEEQGIMTRCAVVCRSPYFLLEAREEPKVTWQQLNRIAAKWQVKH